MGSEQPEQACERHGLWAKLLRTAGASNVAEAQGFELHDAEEKHWVAVSASDCAHGGWRCFFQPLSDKSDDADTGLRWSACPMQTKLYGSKSPLLKWDPLTNDFFGPNPGVTPQDVTAHEAKHLARVFRPLPSVRRVAEEAAREMGWPEGAEVVGVHIRRGDKYSVGREQGFDPAIVQQYGSDVAAFLTVYLPVIIQAAAAGGAEHVYLSTDSVEIAQFLEARGRRLTVKQPGTQTVLTLQFMVSNAMRGYWNLQRAGSYNSTEATLGVLTDSILLAERCGRFVGTHTSAMSKGVYLLMHHRMGNEAAKRTFWPEWKGSNPGNWKAFIFGTPLWSPDFPALTSTNLPLPETMVRDILLEDRAEARQLEGLPADIQPSAPRRGGPGARRRLGNDEL